MSLSFFWFFKPAINFNKIWVIPLSGTIISLAMQEATSSSDLEDSVTAAALSLQEISVKVTIRHGWSSKVPDTYLTSITLLEKSY